MGYVLVRGSGAYFRYLVFFVFVLYCPCAWIPEKTKNLTNKLLSHNPVAPHLGLKVDSSALGSVTRGLVGDTSFAVLPEVTKEHTFTLTLLFQLVSNMANANPLPTILPRVLTASPATALPRQALAPARLGHLSRRRDALRLRGVPLRLARAREGDPARAHPLQPAGAPGPALLQRLPPARGGGPRVAVPAALHGRRVPAQDRLHGVLAGAGAVCVRAAGAGAGAAARVPAGSVLDPVRQRGDPAGRVLLVCAWGGVWRGAV